VAVGTRVGVIEIVGIDVNVEVGLAAYVCARAVWIAWGDGAQAVSQIAIKNRANCFFIFLHLKETASIFPVVSTHMDAHLGGIQ